MVKDQVMEVLKLGKKTKITPVLIGVHGIGKTERVKEFAKKNNMNIIILEISKIDPIEFMGRIYEEKDPKTGEKYHKYTMPHWLKEIYEKDKEGIPTLLFLDEFNRGTKLILNGIMNMINERKFGLTNFKLPESTYIVAAMNPDTGVYNTSYIDDAQFDRFLPIYIEPDFEQWKRDYGLKNMEEEIINFLEENQKYFYYQLETDKMKISLTPRKWSVINKIIKEYKNNIIEDSTLNYLLFNLMGTISSVFIKYLNESLFTFKKFKEFVDNNGGIKSKDILNKLKKEYKNISAILYYNTLSGLLYGDIEKLKKEKDYINLFTKFIPSEILAAVLSNDYFKEKLYKIVDKKAQDEISKKEALASVNDLINSIPELKSQIDIEKLIEN